MKTVAYVLGIALLFAVAAIGGEYLTTAGKLATAPAHIANHMIDKTVDNSAETYEKFRDEYNAFLAQKAKIAQFKTLPKTSDAGELDNRAIEFAGMVQACDDIVAEYNADSEKRTRNVMKFGGQLLPDTLNLEECK